jgi:hypothetical protein
MPDRPTPDQPPEHPGHQPPFPRRTKPESATEQYPHETPNRYPGEGPRIEGLPMPPTGYRPPRDEE